MIEDAYVVVADYNQDGPFSIDNLVVHTDKGLPMTLKQALEYLVHENARDEDAGLDLIPRVICKLVPVE